MQGPHRGRHDAGGDQRPRRRSRSPAREAGRSSRRSRTHRRRSRSRSASPRRQRGSASCERTREHRGSRERERRGSRSRSHDRRANQRDEGRDRAPARSCRRGRSRSPRASRRGGRSRSRERRSPARRSRSRSPRTCAPRPCFRGPAARHLTAVAPFAPAVPQHREAKVLVPTDRVMIRSLNFATTDDSLWAALSFARPKDLKVISNKVRGRVHSHHPGGPSSPPRHPCPLRQDTGRSRGFAFVTFASQADAEAFMCRFGPPRHRDAALPALTPARTLLAQAAPRYTAPRPSARPATQTPSSSMAGR